MSQRATTVISRIIGLLVVGMAVMFWSALNTAHPSIPEKPADPPKASPEVMLATIETHGYITEDDPRVKDYKYVMDAIEKNFPAAKGNRNGIANILVYCQQKMAEKGVKESLTEIGWHLIDSVPRETRGTIKLQEIAALYVTLRIGDR